MAQDSTGQTGPSGDGRDVVVLRLPAAGAYLSVLRTATASLASRLDFTIDDIEDLRIAVGEANAMVLEKADEDADLVCQFFMSHGEMVIAIGVTAAASEEPDYDSFAWQVLTTLATSAEVEVADGTFTVRMTMQSSAVGADL